MNFVDGTRFTIEKHIRQKSPYIHLLRPKAGGVALVLGEMRDHIRQLLDVTIVYQGGAQSFWTFLCGGIKEIKVSVRSLPVGPELLGDYMNDRLFRKDLQLWMNNLWNEKDRLIKEMLTKMK